MGIGRYFLHDFFTASEFNDLEQKLGIWRSVDRQRHATAKARLAALEDDLGRVALLARSLADLCLSKGLVTREELSRQILEADLADGVADQRLQADVVMPGESKIAGSRTRRKDPAVGDSKTKRRRPYP